MRAARGLDIDIDMSPRDLRTRIVEAIVAPNCITDVYQMFRGTGDSKARNSRTVVIKDGTTTLIQRRPFRQIIHTRLNDR